MEAVGVMNRMSSLSWCFLVLGDFVLEFVDVILNFLKSAFHFLFFSVRLRFEVVMFGGSNAMHDSEASHSFVSTKVHADED